MLHWKQALAELDHRKPLPPLHPSGTWQKTLSDEILSADAPTLTNQTDPSELTVQATRAGLLLWNDDLDAAHEIVQDVHEVIGSYWHALIHRREGDYSNSKYWFAKVGQHPIFEPLYNQACRLWPDCQSWSAWSPNKFVDAVAEIVELGEDKHPDGERLRRIQVVEFSLLLRHLL